MDSLEELEKILNTLSEEEYAEMKKRTAKIGERLSQGQFVRKALQEAIERLKYVPKEITNKTISHDT